MGKVDMQAYKGIPVLGVGTYALTGDACRKAVAMALDLGYRHIDTAQMYGNEQDVGDAIKASGIARHELFVVTKVHPDNLSAERFRASVAISMDALGGPADLLLIHWPPADEEIDAALDRLVAEQERGMTRLIGVSNFTPRMMRQAQARSGNRLVNNQVEFHPLLDQTALVDAARQTGMVLSAYTPLGRGAALRQPVVQQIAARLGRNASAVVLRWIIQRGVVAMPMTTKAENARANLSALDFELAAEDMAAISALGSRDGRLINGSWMNGRWDT